MTRSKTELAIILVKLQGEITDPKKIEKEAVKLANEMSLMKLCYEIQKVEEEREEREATAPAPGATQEQNRTYQKGRGNCRGTQGTRTINTETETQAHLVVAFGLVKRGRSLEA